MTTEFPMLSMVGLKARGWTPALVRDFLGEADVLTKNPISSAGSLRSSKFPPMRLYDAERVKAAEREPAFRLRKAGGKGSRAAIPEDDRPAPWIYRTDAPVIRESGAAARENAEKRAAVAQVQSALGVSPEQIAADLGVTVTTVKRKYLKGDTGK